MSDQDFGVLLHDANDVLPQGLVGTPWEIIFKALRDVLKSGVGASDVDFMRKACALYFIARGDLKAVTDRGVLNGVAAALFIPYWVEDFENPEQACAVLHEWINYKATRPKLIDLALASGMRGFNLRETYTSTEYGLYHSFGFDIGDDYDRSFFAGPGASEGLTTAQRIASALTRFFLRIKDAPTLIVDVTYPDPVPSGNRYFFKPDQSQIRILQQYDWRLYDESGSEVFNPDEYAVFTPQAVRNVMGKNTAVSSPSHIDISSSGLVRLFWGGAPVDAYCLYCELDIDIPGKIRAWLSPDHSDVSIPPNTIPGAVLYDAVGSPLTGDGYELFAAYNSALARIDIESLALFGSNPVYLRSGVYVTLNQVWLISAAPSGIDGYFTAAGSAELSETTVGYNSGQWIYDASGNNAVYDSSKIYRIVAVFDLAGNQLPIGADDNLHELIGWVIWESHVSPVTEQPYDAYRMLYEEIEPDGLVAYLSSSGVSGSGDIQCGFNSYQNLYTASGSLAQYTPGATYRILGVYDKNHNKIEASDQDFLYDNGNILWYSNVLPATGQPYEAHHIIYEEVTP